MNFDKFSIGTINVAPTAVATPKLVPTNMIYCVDVSGSMYGILGDMRRMLKNKLTSICRDGDTMTIIWFSGSGQAGVLKEEVEVKSLTDLQSLHDAIDKWLHPVGMTAFAKPIEIASQVIDRISKNRPGSVFSLLFLTDGYHNSGPWNEVVNNLTAIAPKLASSCFVEFGYYADAKRIAEMAEITGGEKIESEEFESFDVVFSERVSRGAVSSKRIEVTLPDPKSSIVFAINQYGDIIMFGNNDGKVLVPEDTTKLFYYSKNTLKVNENEWNNGDIAASYAAVSVFAEKFMNDEAEAVLAKLGDIRLYKMFTNAFGKQKLNAFRNEVKFCITDESKRFSDGRSTDITTDPNAYCVMKFIDELVADEDNVFFPNHEDFTYKRIGAKRTTKVELTEEQKLQIGTAKTAKQVSAIVDAIESPEFDIRDNLKGYSLSSLVWNEERANLSVRVRYEGVVKLPKNNFGLKEVESYIYRTYTIIKDGILNISQIPVRITKATFESFKANGLIGASEVFDPVKIYTIDFSVLPIINKSMVQEVYAAQLAKLELELLELQGDSKVLGYYDKIHNAVKASKGLIEKYGVEATDWLNLIGITDHNGFSPKTEKDESGDVYMALKLKTKIEKMSSLPKVEDVITKIEEKKSLKPSEMLLESKIGVYKTETSSALFKSMTSESQGQVLSSWVANYKDELVKRKRAVMQKIAEIKFSLILSRKWFKEFATYEENTTSITYKGSQLKVTFDMEETEVKL